MDRRNQDQIREWGNLYRLEVQGRIRPDRSRWLGAEAVISVGSNTVIQVRVMDQSDLYGRLRRIHDLNLQLISVQRIDEDMNPNQEEGH